MSRQILVDPEAEPEQAERRHPGVELPELPRREALVVDGSNGVDDAALRLGDAPQMLAREVALLLEVDREEFGPFGDEVHERVDDLAQLLRRRGVRSRERGDPLQGKAERLRRDLVEQLLLV